MNTKEGSIDGLHPDTCRDTAIRKGLGRSLLLRFLLLLMVTIAVACCSKGSIEVPPNPTQAMESYEEATRDLVELTDDEVLYILHRAGSVKEYAKNLNIADFGTKYQQGLIKDVSKLMRRSFKELGAGGIEIDVQPGPEDSKYNSVYVIHDPIPKWALSCSTERYLENNSLEIVVREFIEKKYYNPSEDSSHGNYLFIEFKINKPILALNHPPLEKGDPGEIYIKKTLDALDKVIDAQGDPKKRRQIREHIGFASFNYHALEKAHELAGEKGYKFYFIAAINKNWGAIVSLWKRNLNFLTSALKAKLENSDWLTGIWFDPKGIRNIAETFNGINAGREHPLVFHISTYFLSKGKYLKALSEVHMGDQEDQHVKLKHVEGLIFDIMNTTAVE